jgi:hypothetical protein
VPLVSVVVVVGQVRLDEAINLWITVRNNGQKLTKILYPEDQSEDTLQVANNQLEEIINLA